VTAWWEAFRERGHDVACADIHRAIGLSPDDLISRGDRRLAAVAVNPVPISPAAGRLPGADLAPAARALVARGLRLVTGPLARTKAH
jgi:hypothetical protein